MKRGLLILVVMLCGCGPDGPDDTNCRPIYGNYSGNLNGAPLNASLDLFVNKSTQDDTAELTGAWTNGTLSGKINRADLNCSTGRVDYEYGLSLTGPSSLLSEYPNGATLGRFEGTLTESGGSGSWTDDSGAAGFVGVTGSGSWSVSP